MEQMKGFAVFLMQLALALTLAELFRDMVKVAAGWVWNEAVQTWRFMWR
jgi:hypothetical protein